MNLENKIGAGKEQVGYADEKGKDGAEESR